MLARRAGTEDGASAPISLVAIRRSLGGYRRFLLASTVAFVVMPLVLLAVLQASPPEFVPIIISLAGLIWLRSQSLALEREMRRARVRAIDAIDHERQRIQRDLHDSAQQRLVSARIHVGLLAEKVEPVEERAEIERVERDLDGAIADIRNATRDGNPQLLVRNGIVESLRAAAAHAPVRVRVEDRSFGRYPPAIERGVYFCCLEALQNVIKHGGPGAVVRIRLTGQRRRLSFSVDDSGVGFDPSHVTAGAGLLNLADRVDAMGGQLTVDSHPGLGTRVRAEIPVRSQPATVPVFSALPLPREPASVSGWGPVPHAARDRGSSRALRN